MRRPSLVLVAVCTFWGTIGVVVRETHLPGGAVASGRIWLAAVTLGAVVWARHGRGALMPLRRRAGRVLVAGVTLAFHWLAFMAALTRAPIGTVVLVVFLGPVGVAATAPRVLGERVGWRTLGALGLAVGGLVMVAGPAAGGRAATGVALAAVAAALYVVLVLASKPLARDLGGLRLAYAEMVIAGVVLLPVGLSAGWGPPAAAWAWLVVLGVVHTALAASLYLAALGRVPALHAGILGYLEPASAVLCGWAFLGERPSPATVVGGLLIVTSGAIVVRETRQRESVEAVVGVAG